MANRLFFAIPIRRSQQLPLLKLQAQLPPIGRPVAAYKLHLTLAFLGDVSHAAEQQLLQRWQHLSFSACQLHFNQLQHWPNAQVLALTSATCPAPLYQLASALQQDAANHGLYQSRHGFRPHISLLRDCPTVEQLPQPAMLTIDCDEVQLLRSEYSGTGVAYYPIKRWHSTASA